MSDLGPAASPVPPPAQLVRSPLSDGEWHRMHPLTPLLRGGLFLLVVAGIVLANLRDRLAAIFLPWLVPGAADDLRDFQEFEGNDPIDYIIANNLYLMAVLAIAAVLVVLLGVFWLTWRFHSFRITGDDVEVRSGVVFRTHRRAPLDRVQGVNLTRPAIARLVGLAKLEVVGAGTDANVRLEYLTTRNAEAVRADILRLASGRSLAGEAGPRFGDTSLAGITHAVSEGVTGLIDGAEAPVAEPESVVRIPVGRLVLSHVLSPATAWTLLALVAIAVGVARATPWMLIAFVPAVIGFGAYWIRSMTRSLRYSIAPTPDGVRITFGLFTTVTEIVPPGRVHAIEISQSILWRPAGWWTITVNRLSGRSAGDSNPDQFATVLPVGTRQDAERVLRLLLPHLTEEAWHEVFQDGILGPDDDDPYAGTPRRARLLRPLSWRRNGILVTPDALLLRRGFIWRQLDILPLARLQSVGISQGPLDRALGVAGLRGHTIAGRVSTAMGVIDRDAALAAFGRVEAGILAAAAADRSHRWAGEDEES